MQVYQPEPGKRREMDFQDLLVTQPFLLGRLCANGRLLCKGKKVRSCPHCLGKSEPFNLYLRRVITMCEIQIKATWKKNELTRALASLYVEETYSGQQKSPLERARGDRQREWRYENQLRDFCKQDNKILNQGGPGGEDKETHQTFQEGWYLQMGKVGEHCFLQTQGSVPGMMSLLRQYSQSNLFLVTAQCIIHCLVFETVFHEAETCDRELRLSLPPKYWAYWHAAPFLEVQYVLIWSGIDKLFKLLEKLSEMVYAWYC